MKSPAPSRNDWNSVLSSKSRYAALVHSGASPASIGANNVGLALMLAPYLEEAHHRQKWQLSRSCRVSTWAALELARLRQAGVTAICPTVEIAAMCEVVGLIEGGPNPLDRDGWDVWVRPILHAASYLIIPKIDGWDRCPVIWGQAHWAMARNMPVHIYAGVV